jgi:hypothetical protein
LSVAPLLVNGQTSSPQESPATPANFVQEFYDWYTPVALRENRNPAWGAALKKKPGSFDLKLFQWLKEDLDTQTKVHGKVAGLDFDPFLNSQDPGDHYEVGKTTQQGESYRVDIYELWYGKKSEQPIVTAELIHADFGWVFANFYYPDGRNLFSILRRLRNPTSIPTGKVTGLVLDEDGKSVSGATVAFAKNATKKTILIIRSKSDGSFAESDLPEGTYSVTVRRPGFKPSIISDIFVVEDHEPFLRVILRVKGNIGPVY